MTEISSIIIQENTDSNNHELDGFFSSLKWVQAKFMVQSKTQQQNIKQNIFGSLVDDENKISEYDDDMTMSFYDKREKESVSFGPDFNNNQGYTFVNGDSKSDETNQILSKLDYREPEKETSNSSGESIKDNKSDEYNQSSSEEEIPVVNHYFKEIYDINDESPDKLKHAAVTILTNSMTLNECKLEKSPIIELEEESVIEVPLSECQQSQKPPDLLEMCRRLKSNPDKIILKTPNCRKKLFVMKLKLPEASRPNKQDPLREMLKNLPK